MDELARNEEPFDVLFTDTSMLQSFLAALQPSGRRVLQVDAAAQYGGPAGGTELFKNTDENWDASIDPSPVVAMARGPLVSMLLALDLAEYLAFVAVDKMFIVRNGLELLSLPVSKEQVMLASFLDLKEKRQLTRLLSKAADNAQTDTVLSLSETLKKEGITEGSKLWDLVVYGAVRCASAAEAEAISQTRALEAIGSLKTSLEHMAVNSAAATTPFMIPQYGASELAQAACRRAAVNGTTTQILGTTATISADDAVFHIGQWRMKAHQAVVAKEQSELPLCSVDRFIEVVEEPLLFVDPGTVLFTLPPGSCLNSTRHAVNVLQMASETRCVSPGRWLCHVWTDAPEGIPQTALDHFFSRRPFKLGRRERIEPPRYSKVFRCSTQKTFVYQPVLPASYLAERDFVDGLLEFSSELAQRS